jgi:hypothetical protein
MKKLLLGLTFLASMSAFAVEFSDLAGVYQVTTDLAPITNIIEIDDKGNVNLTEESPYGSYNCSGTAFIKDDVLSSEVTCEDGTVFTQRVNLSGVTSFDEFTANVYSSLYEAELPMNFKKI